MFSTYSSPFDCHSGPRTYQPLFFTFLFGMLWFRLMRWRIEIWRKRRYTLFNTCKLWFWMTKWRVGVWCKPTTTLFDTCNKFHDGCGFLWLGRGWRNILFVDDGAFDEEMKCTRIAEASTSHESISTFPILGNDGQLCCADGSQHVIWPVAFSPLTKRHVRPQLELKRLEISSLAGCRTCGLYQNGVCKEACALNLPIKTTRNMVIRRGF